MSVAVCVLDAGLNAVQPGRGGSEGAFLRGLRRVDLAGPAVDPLTLIARQVRVTGPLHTRRARLLCLDGKRHRYPGLHRAALVQHQELNRSRFSFLQRPTLALQPDVSITAAVTGRYTGRNVLAALIAYRTLDLQVPIHNAGVIQGESCRQLTALIHLLLGLVNDLLLLLLQGIAIAGRLLALEIESGGCRIVEPNLVRISTRRHPRARLGIRPARVQRRACRYLHGISRLEQ